MGEPVAKDLGLRDWPHDRRRWIEAMVANPILIERPILVDEDGRAVLGRPPEAVEDLLSAT
jgi:arsenate reductase